MRLSIIIPAYNEESTIASVIERALSIDLSELGVTKEIIVVDDGSTDRTAEIVRKGFAQVCLIRNLFREGKGSAIRKGFVSSGADWVMVQDADMEYDPREYPVLLEPIARGRAEVVYGSRFLSCAYPSGMRFLNFIGNRIGTALANLLYGSSLTDLMTGFKVFPRKLIDSLSLHRRGFDICAEITAKLLKKKVRIVEVPISYRGRGLRQGKKISISDALFILVALWEERFKGRSLPA